MDTPLVVSNVVVALVLLIFIVYFATIMIPRFAHVGFHYRATVVSAGVVMVCSIIQHVSVSFSTHFVQVDVVQAISVVILAITSIGLIDIVFSRRRQRVRK